MEAWSVGNRGIGKMRKRGLTIPAIRFNTLMKAFDPTAVHECLGNRRAWWPRWSAGRRRALRHWARAVALPREVGTLIPPPGVLRHCTPAPPAAPSPRAGSARDWQTRTLCAARTRKAGCLKFETLTSCPGRGAAFFMPLRRAGTVPNAGVRPRLCSAPLRKSYALRCVRGTQIPGSHGNRVESKNLQAYVSLNLIY